MSSSRKRIALAIIAAAFIFATVGLETKAQPRTSQADDELVKVQTQRNGVRTVTIPKIGRASCRERV